MNCQSWGDFFFWLMIGGGGGGEAAAKMVPFVYIPAFELNVELQG